MAELGEIYQKNIYFDMAKKFIDIWFLMEIRCSMIGEDSY